MTNITVADLTNSTDTTDGTGVFDILIKSVERLIEDQHQKGRLTGSDYATVYLGSMQAVIQNSISFLLSEQKSGLEADKVQNEIDTVIAQTAKIYADIALVEQKQVTELAETTAASGGTSKAKQDLMAAQTLGFASDTKQKVLKQMLEGYAVNLSIAGTATVPSTIKEASIDQLSQEILTDVSSTVDIQSSVQVPDVGV